MPNLFKILKTAYVYTKNHKFLWFFGFFLTGGGILNFVRYSNLGRQNFQDSWSRFAMFVKMQPGSFAALLVAFVISMFIVFFLGAIARTAIIDSVVRLERKEQINMRMELQRSKKFVSQVLMINILISFTMFIIFLWLFLPVLYVVNKGLTFSAVLLAFIDVSIFVPVFIALSMVNIFACCFAVAYGMPYKKAITSSFDLFSRYWGNAISLLLFLFVTYFIIFFFSASILSIIGLLAYGLSVLLKSLSVPFYYFLLSATVGLLGAILFVIYAVLNVYTNISWTLFFLEIARGNPFEEQSAKPVVVEPVV